MAVHPACYGFWFTESLVCNMKQEGTPATLTGSAGFVSLSLIKQSVFSRGLLTFTFFLLIIRSDSNACLLHLVTSLTPRIHFHLKESSRLTTNTHTPLPPLPHNVPATIDSFFQPRITPLRMADLEQAVGHAAHLAKLALELEGRYNNDDSFPPLPLLQESFESQASPAKSSAPNIMRARSTAPKLTRETQTSLDTTMARLPGCAHPAAPKPTRFPHYYAQFPSAASTQNRRTDTNHSGSATYVNVEDGVRPPLSNTFLPLASNPISLPPLQSANEPTEQLSNESLICQPLPALPREQEQGVNDQNDSLFVPKDGDNEAAEQCPGRTYNGLPQPSLLNDRQAVSAVPVGAPNPAVSLPSMMRYLDFHLNATRVYGQHPHPQATCPICHFPHDQSPVATTFETLPPCQHQVHYRCLIWWVTRLNPARDKCPFCYIPLFKWDGVSALTLAARIGLQLENGIFAAHTGRLKGLWYVDEETRIQCDSDQSEYESDCKWIEMRAKRCYHEEMRRGNQMMPTPEMQNPPPKYSATIRAFLAAMSTDFNPTQQLASASSQASPSLVRVYYTVLDEMEQVSRPRASWLQWDSFVGFLLLGMLVCIKVRRCIVEETGNMVGTEGWYDYERVRMALQDLLQREIRGHVS
jgi:hypothetical protein